MSLREHFPGLLEAMSEETMSGITPIEVAIRQHQSDLDNAERISFDHYDDEHMRAILPERLVAPMQALLLTRREIIDAERLGCLNKERALEWLRKDADALLQACKELWAESE